MAVKLHIRVLVILVVVAVASVGQAARAAGGEPVVYRPPVSAVVTDPFRPPDGPYGAGNRGLEYGTAAATVVGAAADGVVTFAGPVAGDLWVTVAHDDGIRTAYGPLATIATSAGASVRAGDAVGTTRGRLLFTARLGDTYLDPAALLAASPGSIRLIPENASSSGGAAGPKALGVGELDPSWTRRVVEWARTAGHATLTLTAAAVTDVMPLPTPVELFAAGLRWRDERDHCTAVYVQPTPPSTRRVAIEIGGLGSTSASAAIARLDTSALGYESGDVLRFSYRGGRVPGEAAPEFGAIDVHDYSATDTLDDLVAASHRLADLMVAAATAVPEDVPVDVVAHSQGGVLTRLALAELAIRSPATLDRLGLVVTLGTPHHGADLAGAAASLTTSVPLELALEAIQALVGLEIEPDATAVRQLAPGSDVIRQLALTPLPQGIDLVSIAARSDPVVPSPRSWVTGATNVVIGVEGLNDHDSLPSSASAIREIGLALDGLPPTCESLVDAVGDTAVGESIGGLERLLDLAARLASSAADG